jgi:hypothetical protein
VWARKANKFRPKGGFHHSARLRRRVCTTHDSGGFLAACSNAAHLCLCHLKYARAFWSPKTKNTAHTPSTCTHTRITTNTHRFTIKKQHCSSTLCPPPPNLLHALCTQRIASTTTTTTCSSLHHQAVGRTEDAARFARPPPFQILCVSPSAFCPPPEFAAVTFIFLTVTRAAHAKPKPPPHHPPSHPNPHRIHDSQALLGCCLHHPSSIAHIKLFLPVPPFAARTCPPALNHTVFFQPTTPHPRFARTRKQPHF